MEEKGSCRFESIPDPLTVGDIFELHCEWPLFISLSAPLRIEFYQDTNEALENSPETKSSPKAKDDESSFSKPSENPYALYLLDIIKLLPGRGSFKVVSYQPGRYNTGFKIVGSQDVLHTKNLYWKVDSVIPQEKKVRKLTIRECYRIMGFPDHFKIYDKKQEAYKQIGNSICVPMVYSIAKQIKSQKLLKEKVYEKPQTIIRDSIQQSFNL